MKTTSDNQTPAQDELEGRPSAGWGPVPLLKRLATPSTQADRVTKMIFEDIIRHELQPGARLKPETLSERYNIGLSPVREALFRLSAEGLVQGGSYRGFEVPEISIDELFDLANVRAELSSAALRDAIRRGDDAWEVGVIAAFHSIERIPASLRGSRDEYADAFEARNWAFHEALESACESPWLMHFIHITATHIRRFRRRFFDYDHAPEAAQAEHKALMEAALARDADKACSLMASHVLDRVKALKEIVEKPRIG